MTHTHQTQIIKIGNSKGIRIPKNYLNALGTKDVILMLKDNSLTITPLISTAPQRCEWESILEKIKIENENDFDDFDSTLTDGIDF